MPYEELRAVWEKEERVAKIKGWDFSHIRGRYEEDPHNNLKEQKKAFENIGFGLLRAEDQERLSASLSPSKPNCLRNTTQR
ncbi:MAG: hypothetical protein IJU52_01740 [Clostridia bacterium]|nr:hypothetical protein [Clostridia bacterium]